MGRLDVTRVSLRYIPMVTVMCAKGWFSVRPSDRWCLCAEWWHLSDSFMQNVPIHGPWTGALLIRSMLSIPASGCWNRAHSPHARIRVSCSENRHRRRATDAEPHLKTGLILTFRDGKYSHFSPGNTSRDRNIPVDHLPDHRGFTGVYQHSRIFLPKGRGALCAEFSLSLPVG